MIKVCGNPSCAREFDAHRSDLKYCSKECLSANRGRVEVVEDPNRICASPFCDKKIERKRYASGKLEPPQIFYVRRYCDKECADTMRNVGNPYLIEEVEFLIGTDSPENLAKRLGYKNFQTFDDALRRRGREDLAERLERQQREYCDVD